MKVVPQAFLNSNGPRKLFVEGGQCILKKTVAHSDPHNQRYLSVPALTFVLRGTLSVELPEVGRWRVQPGQFVLLPRGIYFITDLIPEPEPFEAFVFFVGEELLQTISSQSDVPKTKEGASNPTIFATPRRAMSFLGHLEEVYGDCRPEDQKMTQAKIAEMLHLLSRSSIGESLGKAIQNIALREKRRLKPFMETHFDKPLDVSDYAFLTGRSLSSFQRDFKRAFGQSSKQWLIARRLEKAGEILAHGNLRIADIAEQVGYSDLPHFIKSFRKMHGCSPREYRTQHANVVAE